MIAKHIIRSCNTDGGVNRYLPFTSSMTTNWGEGRGGVDQMGSLKEHTKFARASNVALKNQLMITLLKIYIIIYFALLNLIQSTAYTVD